MIIYLFKNCSPVNFISKNTNNCNALITKREQRASVMRRCATVRYFALQSRQTKTESVKAAGPLFRQKLHYYA